MKDVKVIRNVKEARRHLHLMEQISNLLPQGDSKRNLDEETEKVKKEIIILEKNEENELPES